MLVFGLWDLLDVTKKKAQWFSVSFLCHVWSNGLIKKCYSFCCRKEILTSYINGKFWELWWTCVHSVHVGVWITAVRDVVVGQSGRCNSGVWLWTICGGDGRGRRAGVWGQSWVGVVGEGEREGERERSQQGLFADQESERSQVAEGKWAQTVRAGAGPSEEVGLGIET